MTLDELIRIADRALSDIINQKNSTRAATLEIALRQIRDDLVRHQNDRHELLSYDDAQALAFMALDMGP